MNVLILCKRFPQGRDLLTRPYGRFYHLARVLVEKGHRVHVALLSYRGLPSVELFFDGIDWSSDDLWPLGPLPYLRRLNHVVTALKPDWALGMSDTYFGILVSRLGKQRRIRYAIDAYDDFESYIPYAWPLHVAWRKAIADAELVTAAGPQLAHLLQSRGARRVEVLPMTADPEFRPLDQVESRAKVNLPTYRRLIGHIGAFNSQRGHKVVLEAMDVVSGVRNDASLVLSGRQSLALHSPPAIYGLGYVKDELMPAMVSSLDVACVALADNSFGRSSYPAKLCEAMACRVPVVASSTAPVQWMLRGDKRFLAEMSSPAAMANKILANLSMGRVSDYLLNNWTDIGTTLESFLIS